MSSVKSQESRAKSQKSRVKSQESRVKRQELRVDGSGSAGSDNDIITTYKYGRSSNKNDTSSVTFTTEVIEVSDI